MVEHELVSDYLKSLELLNRGQLQCLELSKQFHEEGKLAPAHLMVIIGEALFDAKNKLDSYEIYKNAEAFWRENGIYARIVQALTGVDPTRILWRDELYK